MYFFFLLLWFFAFINADVTWNNISKYCLQCVIIIENKEQKKKKEKRSEPLIAVLEEVVKTQP